MVVSLLLFGAIWWSYLSPENARPTWQQRLGEGSNADPYPSAGFTRTRSRNRQNKVTPKAPNAPAAATNGDNQAQPEPPKTTTPKEHVAVEITGTTSEQTTWNDPENQKVLGDKRWMAVESPQESDRIQEILNKPMPVDKRATPLDRKASIEMLRPDVEACVAESRRLVPGATGRMVVSYDLSADENTAVIRNAEVDPLVGFEGVVGLRECIISRVEGQTFKPSRQGEPLRVEYPFFFD